MRLLRLLLTVSLTVVSVASSSVGGVQFRRFCPSIEFNELLDKFEIVVPVSLPSVSDVTVKTSLPTQNSGLIVKLESGRLRLLCKTYQRCWQLQNALVSRPQQLLHSLKFSSLEAEQAQARLPRGGLVRSNCNSGWKVFVRRVDGSLSFAQNFKTYERGFGDVSGNFWMGLRNLHAATAAGHWAPGSTCRLRIRAVGNDNKRYNGEYSTFQVLDSSTGYRLIWQGKVSGSFQASIQENGMMFSTYDLDRDRHRGVSCSKYHGFGGWWFNACHHFYPTGRYTTRNWHRNWNAAGLYFPGPNRYVSVRRIVMEFKCE